MPLKYNLLETGRGVTAESLLPTATVAIVLPPTEVGFEDNVVVRVTLFAEEVVVGVVMPVIL